jgi:hypothetical protein
VNEGVRPRYGARVGRDVQNGSLVSCPVASHRAAVSFLF